MQLTEKEKTRMAASNNLAQELRGDRIRAGVKKKYKLEDELAITRKMLHRLLDIISKLHGREFTDEVTKEFKQYYDDVEAIKTEAD